MSDDVDMAIKVRPEVVLLRDDDVATFDRLVQRRLTSRLRHRQPLRHQRSLRLPSLRHQRSLRLPSLRLPSWRRGPASPPQRTGAFAIGVGRLKRSVGRVLAIAR